MNDDKTQQDNNILTQLMTQEQYDNCTEQELEELKEIGVTIEVIKGPVPMPELPNYGKR